jgi:heme-degrading monooxygenase HmoA
LRRPDVSLRAVYARVTELAGFGDRLPEYLARIRDRVLPELRRAPGYVGYLNLVDRERDSILVVSIWASRDEMRASEELVLRLREQAAASVGAGQRWVREYEVAFRDPE